MRKAKVFMDTGLILPPPARAALLRVRRILGAAYLAVGVAAVAAIIATRNSNPEVYAAGIGRLVGGTVMFVFAGRAARGLRSAFTRVRIVSGIITLTVWPVLLVPGRFPTWLRVEQGCSGLIALGVVLIANSRHLRSAFAANETASAQGGDASPCQAAPLPATAPALRGPSASEDPSPTMWISLRRTRPADTAKASFGLVRPYLGRE